MNDIVIINLPDNEDEALNFLLSHKDCNKVKIIGKLKNWCWDINDWIIKNGITYLDLYDLSEMVEWGDPIEWLGTPTGGIYDCDTIEEVVLPENLIGLGTNYFAGCSNLHIIHIPKALEYITSGNVLRAFSETSLNKIYLELSQKNSWIISAYSHLNVEYTINSVDFEEINGVLYDKINKQLLRFPLKYIGTYTFPSQIVSIADLAFRSSQIGELTIPANITYIGMGAFMGAIINTIIFEEGIERILGGDGFQPDEYNSFSTGLCFSKSHIRNILLPSTLKELGPQLFVGGVSFENIKFRHENLIFEIENDIIYNKQQKSVIGYIPNKLNEYVVRDGTKTIGRQAFSCEYVENGIKIINIILPDSLEKIEDKAFYECNIESIKLPENLIYIGSLAFAVSEIKRITIPNGVECIRNEAFAGCRSLIEIKLPTNLKKIEQSVFHSCKSLVSINIPQTVNEIDYSCFEGCTALLCISLPKSLKSISHNLFWECSSMKTISLPENLERIGSCAFWHCNSLKNIQLPNSLKYLEEWAFYDCSALESVNIPTYCEIRSPGDEFYQFEGCNSLLSITVAEDNPYHSFSEGILYNKQGDYLIKSFSNKKVVKILDRVQTIGPKSFADTGCEVVMMSDNVLEIRLMAFSNCANLNHVRFSKNISKIEFTKFWKEDIYGYRESLFGGIFDNCNNLSRLTNVSIDTLQKFPEVFKSISGATVSVEKENTIDSKNDNLISTGPVIPQDILEAINSIYFVDPKEVVRLVELVIGNKNEELVRRENVYLNSARKILEKVRTSLQNIGIIPLRCTSLNTCLRILENPNWPASIVPKKISSEIMKIAEICNSASHSENNYFRKFNDFGYTNTQIIDFCITLIKFVKYVTDFSKQEKIDKGFYEYKYHKCVYGNYIPDETSNTTVGYVQSYVRKNSKTEENERIIEIIHRDNSWRKVTIYEDVLREYYRKTGIEVEEDNKVKVRLVEKRNRENNPYWIAKEVIEIVKKPGLFDKHTL